MELESTDPGKLDLFTIVMIKKLPDVDSLFSPMLVHYDSVELKWKNGSPINGAMTRVQRAAESSTAPYTTIADVAERGDSIRADLPEFGTWYYFRVLHYKGNVAATKTSIASDSPLAFDSVQAPDSLTSYVAGAAEVQPNATCTWVARTSGGTSPLTYEWKIGSTVVGTGPDYTASHTEDFVLKLRVAGNLGQTELDSLSVDVTSSADPCLK